MPKSLAPIPQGAPITDKYGSITIFFRQRWQQLIDSFQLSPTVARVQKTGQVAALATTAAYTTKSAGLYRVSYYMRKTVADGVSSSLTFTFGWVESSIPNTESGAALTTDTTGAQQSGAKFLWADSGTDLTYAVAYASNTPGQMKYRLDVGVEQLAI